MKTPEDIIKWSIDRFGSGLALSTSFQKGGMVVVDIASRLKFPLRILTLDTGRLPEETYVMIEQVRARYGVVVEMVFPDASETERMVGAYGPNLFYRDHASRRLCCQVRKVRPLARVSVGLEALITGLRRDQSEVRENIVQVDSSSDPIGIHPLAYWTGEDVEQYTAEWKVPVHPLYGRGFTSIGCEPCTRAINPGEDSRAGRWWWETDETKECGIHFGPTGRVERAVDVMLREIVGKNVDAR